MNDYYPDEPIKTEVYTLTIAGCDDQTSFDFAACPFTIKFLKSLCDTSVEVSSYVCMPTMSFEKKPPRIEGGE